MTCIRGAGDEAARAYNNNDNNVTALRGLQDIDDLDLMTRRLFKEGGEEENPSGVRGQVPPATRQR